MDADGFFFVYESFLNDKNRSLIFFFHITGFQNTLFDTCIIKKMHSTLCFLVKLKKKGN